MRYESSYDDFAYFTDCRRACRNCYSEGNLEDGWCETCRGIDPPQRDISDAMRRGHEDAARMLRRMGFPNEAAWHEARASR